MPALAALSVFAAAGVSAGIATVVTSHHSPAPAPVEAMTSPASSRSVSASPSSTAPSQPATSARPTWPAQPIPGGPWHAELINREALDQDSLTGSGNSLYGIISGSLSRIDPATGNVLDSTRYSAPVASPPVVVGSTVWVVWSYSGSVVLHGYSGSTLAQVASVTVPVSGQLSPTAQGVLTAGPDGNLYVAAGGSVAVVSPSAGRLIRTIPLSAGQASSVAVSPDGRRLYVSTSAAGGPFSLWIYDLASGTQSASSSVSLGSGGNLVATSGGVWGTVGTGMSQWVWFAPDGDLSRSVRVTQGAGGGLESVPVLGGGTVWIGGSHTVACADPATGKILASATIPTDQSVLGYFGRVTVIGQHAFSDYLDNRTQRAGLARMTSPAQC